MDQLEKSIRNPQKTALAGRDATGRFTLGNMIGKGRPVLGKSLAQLVRDVGAEEISVKEAKIKMTRLEATVRRAWVDAMAGNRDARQFVFERGWGKALQPVVVDDSRESLASYLDSIMGSLSDETLERMVQEAELVLEQEVAALGDGSTSDPANQTELEVSELTERDSSLESG